MRPIRSCTVWGPAAAWAAVLFLLSSLPGSGRPPLLFAREDLVAHALLYAVLGGALAWGRSRSARPPAPWLLVAVGVAWAASDEWHQSFVPGRDPSWSDLAADTVGLLAGYWLSSWVLRRLGERRHSCSTP